MNAEPPTTPCVIFSLTEDTLLIGTLQQGGTEKNKWIISKRSYWFRTYESAGLYLSSQVKTAKTGAGLNIVCVRNKTVELSDSFNDTASVICQRNV